MRVAIAVLAALWRCPPRRRRRRRRSRERAPTGAHRGRVALALDAPRPAQHRRQPGPRRATTAATARGASAPAKGVFSTPVVARRRDRLRGLGRHAGSTRIGPGGQRALALPRRARSSTRPPCSAAVTAARVQNVTFGSGDEYIYRLRTAARPLSRRARTLWRFRATRPPSEGQLVNWWEGNVTMGFGRRTCSPATPAAPSTRSTPRGRRRWVFPTENSVWSNAAIARRRHASTSARST